MPRFELVSEYQPMGDQPQAITKLVEGVDNGLRYQTLLGATGTGKSLGWNDPVFVVEERGGQKVPRTLAIGELIDSTIDARTDAVVPNGDAEILDVENDTVHYYAQAFDPETCSVSLFPIRSFVRHSAPQIMYQLETACGRSATLTGDHNLWVLRNGKLQLIETADARSTDYVPLPEKLFAEGKLGSLDMITLLSGKRLFVEAPETILAYAAEQSKGSFAQTLRDSGVNTPYSKLSAIRRNIRGRGIEVSVFQQ